MERVPRSLNFLVETAKAQEREVFKEKRVVLNCPMEKEYKMIQILRKTIVVSLVLILKRYK